jgi:hypothetical protein
MTFGSSSVNPGSTLQTDMSGSLADAATMGAATRAPVRVATRWCGPNPFAVVTPQVSRRKPASPLRKKRTPTQQDLGSALVRLLHSDLHRGHWRVAIRHYLMLAGCGYEVPKTLQQQCILKMALCAPGELQKIGHRVADWLDLRERHRRPSDDLAKRCA